jgi:L-seryl-tRNA(Ser) seleniumtransferase
MLSTLPDEIEKRAAAFLKRLTSVIGESAELRVGSDPGRSAVGGGAAPDTDLRTTLITLSHTQENEDHIEQKLRSGVPPVIARIEGGRVVVDLRTVAESEEEDLIEAISKLV